ncbi:MAG: hypothetical protein ACR2PW_07550 [Gammaproteobacteria bacterium]
MIIKMPKLYLLLLSIIGCCMTFVGNAQSQTSIEDERAKQLKEVGVSIPDPDRISRVAAETFSKPVLKQDLAILKNLAKDANTFANLVSKLTDGYEDYLRQNSMFEFVTNKVKAAPVVKEYTELDSKFKKIRNQAYLNLGKLALADGKRMEAFLFFNDAYRLSNFSCHNGKDDCIRYEAEQELKKILGVSSESYIHY